jgi:hypothetical protein
MTWPVGLRFSVALGLGVLAGAARPANAVDGVIEINQQKALAGGVNGSLVADPPGFPVTITQPGSYRLTGNLSVDQNTTAILIPGSTQRVSLDLGGFAIEGPNACSGAPGASVTCTYQTSAAGIDADAAGSVTVRNGRIAGMGGRGVILGVDGLIEDIEVASNGVGGALANPRGSVRRVRAVSNALYGIAARVVSDSEARLNQTGIALLEGTGAVSGCVLEQNADNGIVGSIFGSGALISRNTIRSNGGHGVDVSYQFGFGDGTLIDNYVADNVGCGARFSSIAGRAAGAGNNSFIGNNIGGQCVGGAPGQDQIEGNVVATSCNAITCTTGTLQVGTFCPPISTVTCL